MSRLALMTALTLFVSTSHAVQSERFATGEETNPNIIMPASDGIYRFSERADVQPVGEYIDGKYGIDSENRPMSFSAGEPVVLKRLANGMYEVSIVLPDSEIGGTPEKILITEAEMAKAKMIRADDGDLKKLSENFESYAISKEARSYGYAGRGRASYNHGRQGGCVAYVCARVGCSGTTGGGRGMTSYLAARGWRRVACESAPAGSVASWSGGPRGSGHTAIKSGGGWCYDLGCHNPGSGYYGMNCVTRR
jgi:hypothetical protein